MSVHVTSNLLDEFWGNIYVTRITEHFLLVLNEPNNFYIKDAGARMLDYFNHMTLTLL